MSENDAYLEAYKNEELSEQYILFEEGIPLEFVIMKLLTMVHSGAIGINKAYELAEECGLFKDSVIEMKYKMRDFVISHPKHVVTEDMIAAVKEKSKYNIDKTFNGSFDEEIVYFLENRACNIDITVKAVDNFLDGLAGVAIKE